MPRRKTYDVKCHELAQHFMHDKPTETQEAYDAACDSLASHIQEAIEDWFATLTDIRRHGKDIALKNRERRIFGVD